MAKVFFYAMKLDFENLIKMDKDYSETDFAFLIFQPEIEDSEKNRDEYILTAYRVGSDGITKAVIESKYLTADSTKTDPIKGKLSFANLPLSRVRIKEYIKTGSLIDYLLLVPEKFDRNPNYICYQIIPKYKTADVINTSNDVLAFAPPPNEYLHPSPPANA